ncbi:potassium channel family protein [Nitratifractor sp.]
MDSSNTAWIIIRRMRIPLLVIIITFSISILGMTLIPGVDDQGHPYKMSFFDAFYFVSYMASTIGFGEAPYTFTYPQRMWVSACIYLTVIGWFYGIGSIVALIQDKQLARELDIARFRNKIRALKEPFTIILGYNNITHRIIDWLNDEGIRVVVVDRDESKIAALDLENFIPEVPSIAADVTHPDTLKLAGIHKRNCEAVVSLFDDDMKNTKVALLAKLLNKRVKLVIKSTTRTQSEHLHNLGVRYIEDPFQFISNRLYLALTSPNLWLLEMWIFGHILRIRDRETLPRGKYIICGYGRMGHALEKALKKAQIPYTYIDLKSEQYKREKSSAVYGDAEDYRELLDAGVKEAAAIIAATKDDLINLTILSTAKKLNPKIYTIGRENTLDDVTIFKSARINRVYILELILAQFTYLFIARPLAYRFVRLLHTKDDAWGARVVEALHTLLGENPIHFEITVDEEHAYALSREVRKGRTVTLGEIRRSRADRTQPEKIYFLLTKSAEGEVTLVPDDDTPVTEGMQLLVAATEESRTDFEYVVNNYYELEYVLTGEG